MVGERPHEQATEMDVVAFAEKLDAWAQALAPHEQALLHRLISRAAAANAAAEDTQGYIIIYDRPLDIGITISGRPSTTLLSALGLQSGIVGGPMIGTAIGKAIGGNVNANDDTAVAAQWGRP